MKVGTEYYWYHNDHLGTPQVMTTSSGAVVWKAKSSSFGQTTAEPGAVVFNSIRLPGQYFDIETALLYNLNRYYDPDVGRYLRSDPVGLNAGINIYYYAKANPIIWSDPLGLKVWKCRRPLEGQPTEKAPPIFNHAFVCATDENGHKHCGSTTPRDTRWYKHFHGIESRPTTPGDGDYYVESACEEVDEKDEKDPMCVEQCIIKKIQSDRRPRFAIGPLGTDCQEWTDDVVDSCTESCSQSYWDYKYDYIEKNPKPPSAYSGYSRHIK